MAKTYYITESQFKALVESKSQQRKTLNAIIEEIETKKKSLNEASLINEAIIDTIQKYLRAGMLTAAMIGSLLASGQVNAQQLKQAGVPTELVAQAEKVKHDPSQMSDKQIEQKLVQVMKQNGLDGTLRQFNGLNPQQKANIIAGIKQQIKSLDDINRISIGNWTDQIQTGQGVVQFDQRTTETIRVDTVDAISTVPVQNYFVFNSYELANPQDAKQTLDSLVSYFTEIESVTIESSSSTLRNKGAAENMTWKELSQARAEAISNLIVGDNIDLGGEGKNMVGKITPEMITINSDGQNGDGTSGPKSPYESNPEYAKSYQERGIDAKFWQSAATQEALPETQIDQYNQYQYVIVKIVGRIVETNTNEVPSYRYIVLQVSKSGGKVQTGSNKKSQDVSKCPVMLKKQDVKNAPMYK